jgi:hypothetical protein
MPFPKPQFRFPRLTLAAEMKIAEAMKALEARGVKHDCCSRCEAEDWNVDLLEIPANSALSVTGLPTFPGGGASGSLSLLAVVCRNCGNTIFHNLDVLGIRLRP